MSETEKTKTILERGVAEVIDRTELEAKLKKGGVLRIKFGIDPTSPNIHLGRSIPLLKMRDLQDAGHQLVLIIGDFTGVIGDTSDKNAERPMLTAEQIQENLKTYIDQAGKIIDINKTEIRYNSEWLGKLTYGEIGFQTDQFSVNGFIQRELIRRRLEEGKRVSLREVLYPVMQGYDSVAIESDVEIGGMDQKFNILAGRHLQKAYKQEPQNIILGPLINGLDGRKMSSSWGNTVNILDEANNMFGKIMSLHDDLIIEYFTLLTRLPMEQVNKYQQQLTAGTNPRDIKMELARTIVTMYHDADAADQAADSWTQTFSQGGIPEDTKEIKVKLKIPLVEILIKQGLVSSKSEFRRLVDEGAIRFKVEQTERKIIDPESLVEESGALRIGKKRFLKITVEKKNSNDQ